jgi:Suppressor of forked protein (Suf)
VYERSVRKCVSLPLWTSYVRFVAKHGDALTLTLTPTPSTMGLALSLSTSSTPSSTSSVSSTSAASTASGSLSSVPMSSAAELAAASALSEGASLSVRASSTRSLDNTALAEVGSARLASGGEDEGGGDLLMRLYEEAVAAVGEDPGACTLWCDYVLHLENQPKGNLYEEGARVVELRACYHRALSLPIDNLNELWRRYSAWEMKLNELLAREKLLPAQAPTYTGARALARERQALYASLQRDGLALPSALADPVQARQWRTLVDWEHANPQQLDADHLRARVHFTLAQARCALYRQPDVWVYSARYEAAGPQHAARVPTLLRQGIQALPDSLLLRFTLADYYEANKQVGKATEVYEGLMHEDEPPRALACVQYMRFARRSLSVSAARKIFLRCLRNERTAWQVYVAAANMEFRAQKQSDVARGIFERGMKRFATEPGFVLAYVRFLDHLNEDVNMQVLFERVLKRLAPDNAAPIWNDFLHFTYETRDLDASERVEARHRATLPNVSGWQVEPLVERYRFLDLWPCSPLELHALSYGRVSLRQDLAEHEAREGRSRRGRGRGRGRSGRGRSGRGRSGRGGGRPGSASSSSSSTPSSSSSAAAALAIASLDVNQLQAQHLLQAQQMQRKQFQKCNPNPAKLLEYRPLLHNGYSNPLHSLRACSLLERLSLVTHTPSTSSAPSSPTQSPSLPVAEALIVPAGPYTPAGELCSTDRVPRPLLQLLADLPPAAQLGAAVAASINVQRLCDQLLGAELPPLQNDGSDSSSASSFASSSSSTAATSSAKSGRGVSSSSSSSSSSASVLASSAMSGGVGATGLDGGLSGDRKRKASGLLAGGMKKAPRDLFRDRQAARMTK